MNSSVLFIVKLPFWAAFFGFILSRYRHAKYVFTIFFTKNKNYNLVISTCFSHVFLVNIAVLFC